MQLKAIAGAITRSVGAGPPLSDDTLEAALANGGEEFYGWNVEGFGMTHWLPERRYQFAQKRAALFERPRSQISVGKNQKIKSIEQDHLLYSREIL